MAPETRKIFRVFATALRNMALAEEQLRRMIGPGVKHASVVAAERAAAEAKAEEARKAAWPDPPGQLAAAQASLVEAEGELQRHREAAERGAAILAEARARLTSVESEREAIVEIIP